MYYIYMIRCSDNSIYTGITTDYKRRFNEHKERDIKSAKYTKSHEVLKFEALWQCEDRKKASKLEYRIKRLTKEQKERIIKDSTIKYFVDELDYTRIEI